MLKKDDDRESGAVKLTRPVNTSAYEEGLLAAAERGLTFADELDYLIRRWIVPIRHGDNRSVAATPPFRRSLPRRHVWAVSQSMTHGRASIRSNGLLSEVQAAIGRCLSSEYDLAQPMPKRLVDLLRQLEQRNGQSAYEGIDRGGCPRKI
jgi:hypothetical protein